MIEVQAWIQLRFECHACGHIWNRYDEDYLHVTTCREFHEREATCSECHSKGTLCDFDEGQPVQVNAQHVGTLRWQEGTVSVSRETNKARGDVEVTIPHVGTFRLDPRVLDKLP